MINKQQNNMNSIFNIKNKIISKDNNHIQDYDRDQEYLKKLNKIGLLSRTILKSKLTFKHTDHVTSKV